MVKSGSAIHITPGNAGTKVSKFITSIWKQTHVDTFHSKSNAALCLSTTGVSRGLEENVLAIQLYSWTRTIEVAGHWSSRTDNLWDHNIIKQNQHTADNYSFQSLAEHPNLVSKAVRSGSCESSSNEGRCCSGGKERERERDNSFLHS